MQKEIKQKGLLLDEKGHLKTPGYAKEMLLEYRREDIKASKLRVKEWDYYIVVKDDIGIAFTIADNGYMGFVSVSLLHFKERWYKTSSVMKLMPLGRMKLSSSSEVGDVYFKNKKMSLSYLNHADHKVIWCEVKNVEKGKDLTAHITLNNIPKESMVIATPFEENKKAFYYNQKINCMDAFGEVLFDGVSYDFNGGYGTLDFGRGVWTYDNTWYWSSASGTVDGVKFGFNLGYGFGDTSAATENMIFYNGKAHKLDQVTFEIPKKDGKYDFLKAWTFTSNDGRFEMKFKPILDREDKTSLLVIMSDQHQVFGYFTGEAVLDDGTVIEVKDLLGFAEVVRNKW